jgi:glycogen operon protein
LQLSGRTLDDLNPAGEAIRDDTFMMLFNPHHEPIQFYMPRLYGRAWEVILDSGYPDRQEKPVAMPGEYYELIPRSTALLRELTD